LKHVTNSKFFHLIHSGVTEGRQGGTCVPGRSVLGPPNWGGNVV